MIALLLSFLALATSHEFPKVSYLIVSSSFSKDDMEEIEDWKDHKDDLIDACEKGFKSDQDEDSCEDLIDSIESIILSNGKDINEKLAKISKKTEYLFYMVHTRHINVDLNNLQSKMSVYMYPINMSRTDSIIDDIGQVVTKITKNLIISSYDGTIESNIRFSQLIGRIHQNPEVLMEGSITNKVSLLTLAHLRLVYYHEFDCENVYLSSGVLVSMTQERAKVNNFMIDTETFTYYSILSYLKTNQFTLVDFNRDNDTVPEYQIAYYYNFWGIQSIYDGVIVKGRYYWKVPYSVTKRLAIICYSGHIVIEADSKDLTNYPDVNLTVTNDGLIDTEQTLSRLETISIESSGFDTIDKKIWPSVYITYNKDKFQLDTSKSDLDVDEEQIYTYNPKPHHSKVGIIVGSVVAVVVVLSVIIVIVVIVMKKKNSIKGNEVCDTTLLNNDPAHINNYHDPALNTPNLQA